jgi:predicted RNase H-like HicB family nuclease
MDNATDVLYIDIIYATDDEDYGGMYIASNDQIGLVTDGKTFEALLERLKEALDNCLRGVDTLAEYHILPNPLIELRIPFRPHPHPSPTH